MLVLGWTTQKGYFLCMATNKHQFTIYASLLLLMLICHVNKATWFSPLQAIQYHKQHNIMCGFKYMCVCILCLLERASS